MKNPPDGYVSVQEAVRLLGITKARTYQLIEMGRLPSLRTSDNRIWVPLTAIETRIAGKQRLGSPNCVSSREVAEFHGVDTKTVREWFGEGLLKATRIGNRLCFSPQDVINFVPPTYGGPGRLPKRAPTRTLRGRTYPTPQGQQPTG